MAHAVGELAGPGFEFRGPIDELFAAITEWAGSIGELIHAVGKLGSPIGGLIDAVGELGGSIVELGRAIDDLPELSADLVEADVDPVEVLRRQHVVEGFGRDPRDLLGELCVGGGSVLRDVHLDLGALGRGCVVLCEGHDLLGEFIRDGDGRGVGALQQAFVGAGFVGEHPIDLGALVAHDLSGQLASHRDELAIDLGAGVEVDDGCSDVLLPLVPDEPEQRRCDEQWDEEECCEDWP